MIVPKVPAGHVRALVERPRDPALVAAANEVLAGGDPTSYMSRYAEGDAGRGGDAWDGEDKISSKLEIDPTFGAIPIGRGAQLEGVEDLQAYLKAEESERFLVSGFVEANGRVPQYFLEKVNKKEQKYPIHSNPLVGGLRKLPPCLPTCGTSQYVGTSRDVRANLGVGLLKDNGLDGSRVAIAIVDSGIYKRRIRHLLGDALKPPRMVDLDEAHSWKPSGLVTQPGKHRVGHGTMCAYDALIAAPKATLLDFPMLLARPVADHHSTSMAAAAMLAYQQLAVVWGSNAFKALVVSNSWGLFHPCLEDFPPGHPYRFIDNPNHIFHGLVQSLAAAGVDIIFCGNNCGDGRNCAGDCASGTCLSKTDHMIMGANAYPEVLTVGGCDTNDQMVGYSSRGPSISGFLYDHKPDLVAYTHFLGSKVLGMHLPDTGVSAACPVAAGCVAALRTKVKPTVKPKDLFDKLRSTARTPPGGGAAGWKPDFGYGIIDPVKAGRALGVIP